MAVVSAGVHFAFDGAGVGESGFFVNGQGVDVGPQQDGLLPFAGQVSQGPRAAAQVAHMLNAKFGQVLADDFGGSVLVVRQFGMPMDVVADLDEIRNDGSDAFCVRGHATRIGDEPLSAGGAIPYFVDPR